MLKSAGAQPSPFLACLIEPASPWPLSLGLWGLRLVLVFAKKICSPVACKFSVCRQGVLWPFLAYSVSSPCASTNLIANALTSVVGPASCFGFPSAFKLSGWLELLLALHCTLSLGANSSRDATVVSLLGLCLGLPRSPLPPHHPVSTRFHRQYEGLETVICAQPRLAPACDNKCHSPPPATPGHRQLSRNPHGHA